MNKQKEIKKIVIFFLCILFLLNFSTFCSKFAISDQLWNFQNIYKMHQGALIYKDINVIITPIFYEISNIIFSFLGANVLIFKIYNVIIFFLKFLLMYFIFQKLHFKQALSILYLSLWFIIDIPNVFCGANYNELALVFVLIGILIFFAKYRKNSYHLWQGFIIYLVFFTKQTLGIYYAFGIVLFELVTIGLNKKFFKNQLLKLATFLPFFTISILIMIWRGNFLDFVNLCFGGIFEFGSSNFSITLINVRYFLYITLTLVFAIIILKNKQVATHIRINIIFLLIMAILLTFNMYPLVNQYHSIMSMTFYYILFVYMLDRLMLDELLDGKKQEILSVSISCIMLFFIFAKISFIYLNEIKGLNSFEKDSPFYNLRVSTQDIRQINIVTNYIKLRQKEGLKVMFLTSDAFAYMIPLNLNNNEFDLLFSGNLGYKGIQRTIDKIANMKNTEFVIYTDEDRCFYQESKEIREYIINHLEKKDELLHYSIYINP